jgi:hypothetical protein
LQRLIGDAAFTASGQNFGLDAAALSFALIVHLLAHVGVKGGDLSSGPNLSAAAARLEINIADRRSPPPTLERETGLVR